jgi:hypothetical protein
VELTKAKTPISLQKINKMQSPWALSGFGLDKLEKLKYDSYHIVMTSLYACSDKFELHTAQ